MSNVGEGGHLFVHGKIYKVVNPLRSRLGPTKTTGLLEQEDEGEEEEEATPRYSYPGALYKSECVQQGLVGAQHKHHPVNQTRHHTATEIPTGAGYAGVIVYKSGHHLCTLKGIHSRICYLRTC